MPANRRHRRREHREDLAALTHGQRYHLLNGVHMIDGFTDRETFAAAWEIHGEELLAEFVREHPGRRPFAYWLLEHGRERPLLPGMEARAAVWRRQGDRWPSVHFGFLHTETIPPIQETETDYLQRHNLLTRDERAALAKGDS